MSDLISRADAIDAVKETKPIVRSTERNWGKMIAEQHSKELVKALKALPSADAEPTVIRAKTFMRKEDFDKWAEDIKKQNKSIVCIPCDAEVVSADAVQGGDAEVNETKSPYMQQSRHDDGRMTKEEAIRRLDGMKSLFPYENNPHKEAIDMAIEALSQPIVAKHFDIQSGYIYCSPQIAENVKVVVRCKDCKWYKPNQLVPVHPLLGGGIVYENHCDVNFGFAPKENDFCSRGERREP